MWIIVEGLIEGLIDGLFGWFGDRGSRRSRRKQRRSGLTAKQADLEYKRRTGQLP